MSYGNIISRSDVAALQKESVLKTQRGPSVSPGKGPVGKNPKPAFKNISAAPKR